MQNREIERKFLVNEKIVNFINDCEHRIEISQGYLSKDPERIVRIRHITESYGRLVNVNNFSCGIITIKTKQKSDTAPGVNEFEYRIPAEDAMVLLDNSHQPIIRKTRHIQVIKGHKWEVDVFSGHKEGLILAEVELDNIEEEIELPVWIREEVTGQSEYSNANM